MPVVGSPAPSQASMFPYPEGTCSPLCEGPSVPFGSPRRSTKKMKVAFRIAYCHTRMRGTYSPQQGGSSCNGIWHIPCNPCCVASSLHRETEKLPSLPLLSELSRVKLQIYVYQSCRRSKSIEPMMTTQILYRVQGA